MRPLIIIPARLESTRLPRKLLLRETGKSVLQHTWEQAIQVGERCIIATGDLAIANDVLHYGVFVQNMQEHPNGTSRLAEFVTPTAPDGFDLICIVQADEPEIDPKLIEAVIDGLEQHPEWDCATAAKCNPSLSIEEQANRNRVTVYAYGNGLCRDFTRGEDWTSLYDESDPIANFGRHIGIYCYRREALLKYAAAGPCEREQAESLEQLRALHIGLKMGVILWDGEHHGGIDTREDYDAFVKRWKARQA